MKQPSRKQTMTGGFLIFLLVLGAYIVGFIGWGSPAPNTGSSTSTICNSPGSILQCGTVTFTLSASSTNTQTITFSPAFASAPKFLMGTPLVWPAVSITLPAPVGDYCFICPDNTGQAFPWANMPAANTEIFGDANREHQIFATSPFPSATISGGTFRASVNCNTGSNSGTAVLRVEWSTDDATWNDLANTGGQGDMPIDAAVNCPAAGTIIPALGGNSVNVNTAFPGSSNRVYLRVVGINGGGLGDTPVLVWIHLTIKAIGLAGSVTTPCVLDNTAISASSTSERLRCFATTTVTVTFPWTAQQ